MQRYFVIETERDFSTVWVFEVTKDWHVDVEYHRKAGVASVIYGEPGPKFYGKLDVLINTKNRIEKAEPIIPVVESGLCAAPDPHAESYEVEASRA